MLSFNVIIIISKKRLTPLTPRQMCNQTSGNCYEGIALTPCSTIKKTLESFVDSGGAFFYYLFSLLTVNFKYDLIPTYELLTPNSDYLAFNIVAF